MGKSIETESSLVVAWGSRSRRGKWWLIYRSSSGWGKCSKTDDVDGCITEYTNAINYT